MRFISKAAAAILYAALCVLPVYADPDAISIPADNIVMDSRIIDVSGQGYVIDADGKVYFMNADGTVVANGVAPDQCVYDENGVQVNTFSYIGEKYKQTFEDTPDGGTIRFDSVGEALLFIQWYQITKGSEQGEQYYVLFDSYEAQLNGQGPVCLYKSDFKKTRRGYGDCYFATINEIAGQIDPSMEFEDQINEATRLVANTFDFDLTYKCKNLEQALEDRKGVCYHYAKLLNGVLDKIGIESEYMIGKYNNGQMHVWNCIRDASGKRYYRDATATRIGIDTGVFAVNTYSSYLMCYRMCGLDELTLSDTW